MSKIDKDVKSILPDLLNNFSQFVPPDSQYRVVNYSGIEGLQQVTRNSLQARDGLYIFEIETMSAFLDFGFCEEVREGFVKNNIHVKEFTNNPSYPAWTKVQEFVNNFWECKYINPEILKVEVEILAYNDVVTLYNYKRKDIFCQEIHNQELASMVKQMFSFMWHYGQLLKKGEGGATSL